GMPAGVIKSIPSFRLSLAKEFLIAQEMVVALTALQGPVNENGFHEAAEGVPNQEVVQRRMMIPRIWRAASSKMPTPRMIARVAPCISVSAPTADNEARRVATAPALNMITARQRGGGSIKLVVKSRRKRPKKTVSVAIPRPVS